MCASTRKWSFAVLAVGPLVAGCASGGPEPAGDGPQATAAADAEPAEQPATPSGHNLPVTREEIVAVFAEHGLPAEAFDEVALDDGRKVFTASFPENSGRQALWVALFGGETPHTIRMDLFPNNAQPEEAVAIGNTIDGVLTTMFPEWPDATDWPEVAGGRAWQETRKLQEADPETRQLPSVGTQRGDVSLDALGVPPELLSYVFTTRDVCRPSRAEDYLQGYSGCR